MSYCKIIKKNIRKTVVVTLLFFAAFSISAYLLHINQATGSTADNVSGYAWSGTIGWINFNAIDCDTDGNGFIDTDAMVLGCGGDNSTDTVFDYGVSIDSVTGDFSGYAWGENVGWIDFAPSGLYPELPNNGAHLESDDTVSGWAKALSADALDWDGWIKLSDTSVPAYGVTLNTTTNEFEGYAWGGDVVGWISFNHKDCDADEDGFSDGAGGCPVLGIPIPEYAVV